MDNDLLKLMAQCSFASMVLRDAAQRNLEDDFLHNYYNNAAKDLWDRMRSVASKHGKNIGEYGEING